MSDVSIVIPVWHDASALRSLLPQLLALNPPAHEIIVVDGAAEPEVADCCARHGARYLANKPGRGAQLNTGAAAARGAVLWFVHADAGIDASSIAAIQAAVAAGAVGGYFRFRFAGVSSGARRMLERGIAWRCRHGMVYGDQALFATRAAFDRAGGFAPQPLFEEVPLVRSLRAQGPFQALALAVQVSTRRWDRDGWLSRTLQNRLLALAYACGVSPTRLAEWYRRRG